MGSTEIDSSELQIFSNRLKELRSYKKITQKEFAEKIGITAAALSSYENNGKNPSIAVVKRISEEFDVSIDWLCGFSDKMYLNSKVNTLADVALKIVDLLESGLQYDFRLKKHTDSVNQYGCFYLDFPYIPKLDTFFENYLTLQNLSCDDTTKIQIINTWLNGAIEELKKYPATLDFSGIPLDGLPFI